MKQKLSEEYLNRTKSILKTKLKEQNTMTATNTYATPVLTFSCGIVMWSPTHLENLQNKMRTLTTRYRFQHPHAAKKRITLPRQMRGRGMTDIIRLHDKQVKLLQKFLCFSDRAS
jgi:GTP:adenosylcobinamide-phosphate guanylyltransferase